IRATSASASISCSAPRTSSARATTPPTSRKRSTTWSKATRSPMSVPRATPPPPPIFLTGTNDDLPPVRENIMTARILIIEDEEPLTLLLRYNLEAEGYSVDSAVRGDEADLKLKENAPDLAVIDWMLPGLSGIELIRRLRARPETQALPIIMLTARGEETERVR